MQTDLKGRVKNTYLPVTKALLPLFEAVVNSIHAIEDANISNGCIDIFIERNQNQQILLAEHIDLQPIESFKVVDNGIGFNEEHFNSFQTSDTTLKASKGSKGIGRFLWLKAFSSVVISSTYISKENDFYTREFNFELSDAGIVNIINHKTDLRECQTTVKLVCFDKKYQKHCPHKALTIAKKILEHCLVYFLTEDVPTVRLFDTESSVIIVNDLFKRTVKPFSNTEAFKIKSKDFEINHLKFYFSGDDTTHELHYCANNREVINEELNKSIPDLNKKLRDIDGKTFIYLAYVSSKYLDDRVNSERTDFNLINESEIDYDDEITKANLRNEVFSKIKTHLASFLQNIRSNKLEEIETYVITKAPQYRPLLKHKPETLDEIAPGISEDKLDIELYRLSSRVELELREKSNEILNSDIENFNDYTEYVDNYNKFIEQFNDFGKSRLAQYIAHRKIVLDLFANNLKKTDDDGYKLEKDIHEIIFPLRHTSDEIDFEKQNLWIIDERLSYHKYLASDKPFNQMSEVLVNSSERPDLIIFNQPFAFVEGDLPYASIVIVEFKRPMRKNYQDNDNPIAQVYGYIKKIQAGEVNDKNGRVIPVPERTPFYAYIICDITPKIRELAEMSTLRLTPDHMGYFGYNENFNAYVEIISFDKLISDAKKRNSILFDKLQLPINH
jgi:hypothetical protein